LLVDRRRIEKLGAKKNQFMALVSGEIRTIAVVHKRIRAIFTSPVIRSGESRSSAQG